MFVNSETVSGIELNTAYYETKYVNQKVALQSLSTSKDEDDKIIAWLVTRGQRDAQLQRINTRLYDDISSPPHSPPIEILEDGKLDVWYCVPANYENVDMSSSNFSQDVSYVFVTTGAFGPTRLYEEFAPQLNRTVLVYILECDDALCRDERHIQFTVAEFFEVGHDRIGVKQAPFTQSHIIFLQVTQNMLAFQKSAENFLQKARKNRDRR